jgi:hypothetical protein
MQERHLASISRHAGRRLAQRNLSHEDVSYVLAHGRLFHSGHARFVHLGRRDIPSAHLRQDRIRRLEGTILVLDADSGEHLTTAYRNRRRGVRDIKRKSKHGLAGPRDLRPAA